MTYLSKKATNVKVGSITLPTSGVTISLASPVVTLSAINWGTSNGSASVSNNNIVLSPNKKYILQATLSSNTYSLGWSSDRKFRWYNETASSWIGKLGYQGDANEAWQTTELVRADEAARTIFINGNSNTSISLKYSGTTNQSYLVGGKYDAGVMSYLTAYGRLEIWEFS